MEIKTKRLTARTELTENTLIRLSHPLTVYKKIQVVNPLGQWRLCYAIAVLQIPRGALVSRAMSNKHRASSAKVMKIYLTRSQRKNLFTTAPMSVPNWDPKNPLEGLQFAAYREYSFEYSIGKIVTPKGHIFSKNPREECAPGIHFFRRPMGAFRYGI